MCEKAAETSGLHSCMAVFLSTWINLKRNGNQFLHVELLSWHKVGSSCRRFDVQGRTVPCLWKLQLLLPIKCSSLKMQTSHGCTPKNLWRFPKQKPLTQNGYVRCCTILRSERFCYLIQKVRSAWILATEANTYDTTQCFAQRLAIVHSL